MEIERKYAVMSFPGELSQYKFKKIEQGYLCHKPILRFRRSNEDYILTYKSKLGIEDKIVGSAIFNNEVELPLTKEAYNELRPKRDGNLVQKTRYLVPLEDGLTAELDVFEGLLTGLIMVEVEFPSEEASNSFVAPNWFGKELTSDKRYSNHYLSKLGSFKELGI